MTTNNPEIKFIILRDRSVRASSPMDSIPICRVCMKTSLEYIDFDTPFERYYPDNDKSESYDDDHSKPFTYLDCFRICTHLELTEDFVGPQSLCDSCGMDLKITYDFLQKANRAHQILLKANRHTKLEIVKEEEIEFQDVQQYFHEDPISVKNYASDEEPEQKQTNAMQEISNYDEDDYAKLQIKQEIFQSSSEDENECTTTGISLRIKPLAALHKENKIKSGLMTNIYKYTAPVRQKTGNKDKVNGKVFVVKSSTTEPSPRRSDRHRPTKKKSIKTIELEMKEEDDEEEFACELCNKRFTNMIQLRRHVARELSKEKLLCHACPRTFRDARGLRLHEETHQEKRERNFTCEHCGRKFFQQNNLKDHLKTHEINREPAYKCDECDKSFYHRGSLTVHQQSHSGKRIECAVCGKRYLRQIDLLIHSRGHSGDLPYKCNKCDKAFAQVGHLKRHLLRHDGYRYECDICGKDYLHQSTLIQHRKEHTGMPLKCSICDKSFAKLFKMRRHIQGVHKVDSAEEAELLIIKMKTKKQYRKRMPIP